MKQIFTLISIAFCCLFHEANGQLTYYQVQCPQTYNFPHIVTVGGNTVEVTGNGTSNVGASCFSNPSNTYEICNGAPNSFSFDFQTKPVSHIRLIVEGINATEELHVILNNSAYAITTNDLSAYPGICNRPSTTVINNGILTSNSLTSENAQVDINPGFPIFNAEIKGVPTQTNGAVFHFELYFVNDACYLPFTASASDPDPCVHDNITLTADYMPNATYNWIFPNVLVSQQGQTISLNDVKLSDAGTYTVTASRPNCPDYIKTVNINVLSAPKPINLSNNGPLCPGSTLNLSTGTIPNVSYMWEGPDNFTSNVQNPTLANITGQAGGWYKARTQAANGCISDPDSTQLQLFFPTLPPVAGGNTPVCPGTSLGLTASTIAGATYTWTGPNFSSNQQNPTLNNVQYADAGFYAVTATLNGCTSLPDTVEIKVEITTPTPTGGSNSPACPGTDLNLTASTITGATYDWKGPGFSSTQQNPVIPNITTAAAGKYYVTATVNGCTSLEDTVDVIVAILAATPEASNNGPVCFGKTLQLNATTIPGATYEWVGPNFTSTDQNPVIPNFSAANVGTYQLYAVINGCRSLPDATVVEVDNSTPVPTATGNGPLCIGDEIKLTASDVPNASYSWEGPGNFSSDKQNVSITPSTPADSGDYTVVAIVDGCRSEPATVRIDYKFMPEVFSATSNSPVCEDDSLVLTAKGNDHVSAVYTWKGPNDFATNSHYVEIKGIKKNATGTYTVTASLDGCVSAPKSTDVIIKTRPVVPELVSNTPVRMGDTLVLSGVSSTPGASYSWTGPAMFSSKDTLNFIYNASKEHEGFYTVTATLDGCSSSTEAGVMIDDRETFVLFPNPNQGDFTIKASLNAERTVPIAIINPMGQTVYLDEGRTVGQLMIKNISLGGKLSNGNYILRLGLPKQTRDMKFTILR